MSATPAHARTDQRAVPLDPVGIVGDRMLVAVVAAGFGAVALLLVVGIVMILRNRRAARAIDPAPGLRTLLYVDE